MGVLNVTPDSFSDGGKYLNTAKAIKHAKKLIADGADIVDIGGESSRPYAKPVSLEQELSRVIPVIKALKSHKPLINISVDTYKPEVMLQALNLGVNMINDIYALSSQASVEVIANNDCDICIMHMQNTPQNMQNGPKYANVIDEIMSFFDNKINYCVKNNIAQQRIIIDPGFGFGKTLKHNLEIIKNLTTFKKFGVRLLVGLSQKSMFKDILGGRVVAGRTIASTVCNHIALDKGADIIRTHNPLATSDMIKVRKAIYEQ